MTYKQLFTLKESLFMRISAKLISIDIANSAHNFLFTCFSANHTSASYYKGCFDGAKN